MDTVEVAAAMGVVIDIICKDGDLIHPYMLDQSMGALGKNKLGDGIFSMDFF